jgi:predicted amidohydrolase YtcJ
VNLPVRLRLIKFPLEDPATWQPPANTDPAQPASALSVWGTKWIIDGTPIERLAFLTQDYADRPKWRGQSNFKDAPVRSMLLKALESRAQVLLHTAGDAAIGQVFSGMTAAGSPLRWQSRRLRLEHGDLLTGDLIARARSLGVIVVQNPSHLAIAELKTRFGAERMTTAQPLKSLLAAGIPLAIGSDGPLSPGLNIMLATTHPNNPAEALSREEAVRAYTYGSAYAEFAEQEKGTIAPKMLADLAILSQDIFTAPPESLADTTAVITIAGGKVVHEAK